MRERPNVAIIGCGRMGQRRANALGDTAVLIAVSDLDVDKAVHMQAIVNDVGIYPDWRHACKDLDIDIVIVCTTPDVAPEIAFAAAQAGKHVLIEKPGATHADDLQKVFNVAWQKVKVRVGYNLRYHRAIREAHKFAVLHQPFLGDLMYIRGVYGHGGRLGMEKEWRCDPKISGGGELIDQGVHLIDLSRWFLGDFNRTKKAYAAPTCFWNTEVEDNIFLLMRTEDDPPKAIQLHASWTEWRNTFLFEIFGTRGKLEINGLGGSYGIERLTLSQMSPQMGPPQVTSWEYLGEDDSFETEWAEFLRDIREDREPEPGIRDAQAVLRVVEEVYGTR